MHCKPSCLRSFALFCFFPYFCFKYCPHQLLLHIWHSLCCCVVLTFCHHKSCLSFVLIDKISTWTTGMSLSRSTMRNKMTSTQELYCKCYELLLVCISFSNAFHLLAPIVQMESVASVPPREHFFIRLTVSPQQSNGSVLLLCLYSMSMAGVFSPKMGQF